MLIVEEAFFLPPNIFGYCSCVWKKKAGVCTLHLSVPFVFVSIFSCSSSGQDGCIANANSRMRKICVFSEQWVGLGSDYALFEFTRVLLGILFHL